MNKILRKTVEAELNSVVTAALSSRDKKATATIKKQIKEGVKGIAKKFAKHVNVPVVKKPAAKASIKVAASPAKTAKKVVKKKTGPMKKI